MGYMKVRIRFRALQDIEVRYHVRRLRDNRCFLRVLRDSVVSKTG